jgi:cell division protein FtsB
MRLVTLSLTALLGLIQYPLWLGESGWLKVGDLEASVGAKYSQIEHLKARNTALASEVQDLKDGKDAAEERARYDLGMIKQDEIYVHVLAQTGVPAPASQTARPSGGNDASLLTSPATN